MVHLPALWGGQYFLDIYLTEVHPSWVALEQCVTQGQLPFWSSDILLGYPLASNPQVGALYPLNWLFAGLFGAARGIVFSVWTHSLLGAFGFYALARRGGLSATAAVLASLIVVNSPFFLFYHQAIHGLIALAWFPWILWCGWAAAETGSWRIWVLGTVCLALQMYAGHLQFVAYTVLALFVLLFFGPQYASRRGRWNALWKGMLQQLVALLLYGPQLLLSFVLWRNSLRAELQASDMTSNLAIETFGADDLIELLSPQYWGGPSFADFWYPEFLGIVVLILIVASFFVQSPKPAPRIMRVVRILWAVGFSYLVLMCVPGVNKLFASIPGLSAFRAPGRLFYWLLVSGALMAGHGAVGLQHLWTDTSSRMKRVRMVVLTGLLCAVFGGGFLIAGGFQHGLDDAVRALRVEDGVHLVVSASLMLFGLIFIRFRPELSPHLPVYLGLLAVASISWVGMRYVPTIPADVVESPPLAPVLRHNDSHVRRIVGLSVSDRNYEASVPGLGWPQNTSGSPEKAGWGLHANVGMAHGIQNLHGQTSLPLRRYVRRMFGDGIRPLDYPFHQPPDLDSHLLAHVGVTHVVTAAGRSTDELPIQPLPEPTGTGLEHTGYRVHTLPYRRAPARFYPHSALEGVDSESAAMAAVQRTGENPDVPLVVEGIRAEASGGTPLPVPLTHEIPGAVTFEFDAPEDGVILYTEAWFPGWMARVNDEDVSVLVADGMFIGIPVSKGVNAVELKYRPIGLTLGGGLMILGLLLCFFGLTRGRKTSSFGKDPIADGDALTS